MDKYIKANELIDSVIESKNYNPHENLLQRQNHIAEHRHFITMIDSMKAEEVTPVRHGIWRLETDEEEPNPMFKLAVCSACSEKANTTYKYCPNCGAKMITPIKLRPDKPEDWELVEALYISVNTVNKKINVNDLLTDYLHLFFIIATILIV